MSRMVIMRGLPGSGKSTHVAELVKSRPDIVVVCRDNLRHALFGRYTAVDEDYITDVEHAAIRSALAENKDVIVDATHIRSKFVTTKIKIAYEYDAEVEIVEVNTPLTECLLRNATRADQGGRFVPPGVIEKMSKAYKHFEYIPLPTFDEYEPDDSLPRAILVDIDGTIAEMNGRGPYDWDKVDTDNLVEGLAHIISVVALSNEIEVILFSGRESNARAKTEAWLQRHGVQYSRLYMRDAGDRRADTIVKMEMFDEFIRDNYNVLGVFDDRPAVVRQWMKHKIPVYHVAPYAKDF